MRKILCLIICLFATSLLVTEVSARYWFGDGGCGTYVGYERTVDIMMICDEEFQGEFPHGWERYLGWGIYFDYAFGQFKHTFGIDMKIRIWYDTWDSDDSSDSLCDLAQEALRETGYGEYVLSKKYNIWWWVFKPQWISIDPWGLWFIDMVVIMTGQQPVDCFGISVPDWKAMIIEAWKPDIPRIQGLMHEFSHQYWCLHCDNDCVMNPGLEIMASHWCSNCQNVIRGNKNRFTRWAVLA